MARTPSRKKPETLPADPMPARVPPCVATLASNPPEGPAWAYEVKWDGYRIALHIEPGRLRILTRNGHDWTARFPAIVADVPQLGVTTAIIDAEAVVLDDEGRSDFHMLERALGRPSGRGASDVIAMAFDLLYLNGRDLRGLPEAERRQMLEPLLASGTEAIKLSEEVDATGEDFYRVACHLGLEGIVCKRRDSPYRSGRRPEWIKVKCTRRDWFAIVGFEPSATGRIRRLLLAAKKGQGLVYVGSVGTGFTDKMSRELRRLLEEIRAAAPAVTVDRKGAVFTEPLLVASIEYRAWTIDEKLRHPSFKDVDKLTRKVPVFRF